MGGSQGAQANGTGISTNMYGLRKGAICQMYAITLFLQMVLAVPISAQVTASDPTSIGCCLALLNHYEGVAKPRKDGMATDKVSFGDLG